MNIKMIAIVLIVFGLIVLAYAGISFNTPGQPINFLGIHIETTVSHFISPTVGTIALIGGIVLLLFKSKSV